MRKTSVQLSKKTDRQIRPGYLLFSAKRSDPRRHRKRADPRGVWFCPGSVEPLVVVPVVRCAMVMDLFVVLVGHLVV